MVSESHSTISDSGAVPAVDALKKMLIAYVKEENPRYAVLVSGSWGVGKTHRVKNVLEAENQQVRYVSLSDIVSVEQLQTELAFACDPSLMQHIASGAETGAKMSSDIPFGSVLGTMANVGAAWARRKLQSTVGEHPIIIDDIERCSLSFHEIFGVLNPLVEHQKAHLVLIAATERIRPPDAELALFDEIKEKLVGRHVVLEQDLPAAYTTFCSEASQTQVTRQVLSTVPELVQGIVDDTNIRSLRVVRFALRDAARFLDCWNDEQLENRAAVEAMLIEIIGFGLLVHGGHLQGASLLARAELYSSLISPEQIAAATGKAKQTMQREKPPLERLLNARGSGIFFQSTVPDVLLHEMVVDGVFNCKTVQDHLTASRYFAPPEERKPWEIVINYRFHDQKDVDHAMLELIQPRSVEAFDSIIDLLHHVDAKLFLAAQDLCDGQSIAQIEDEAKQWVEDFALLNQLPQRNKLFASALGTPTGGMGYAVKTLLIANQDIAAEAFKRTCMALDDAWLKMEKRDYTRRCNQALTELRERGLGLDTLKNGAIGEEQRVFVRVEPYLQVMDPDKFVDAWLESPVGSQFATRDALRRRYRARPDMFEENGELRPEYDFITAVTKRLDEFADEAAGLHKRRLQELSPHIELSDEELAVRVLVADQDD